MKDRFVAGALAGIIGAIVQDIYAITIKSLGIIDRSYIDFASVMIMSESIDGILGFMVGLLAHVGVGVLFGLGFAYIIKKTSSNYLLFKGIIFGLSLWFLLLGYGTTFKLPMFKNLPPLNALTTFVGAVIYGVVTAYTLRLIDKKTSLL